MDSHKSKMLLVFNELIKTHNDRIMYAIWCKYCGGCADEKYTREIYWCKYTFCNLRCQYDFESDMRKRR